MEGLAICLKGFVVFLFFSFFSKKKTPERAKARAASSLRKTHSDIQEKKSNGVTCLVRSIQEKTQRAQRGYTVSVCKGFGKTSTNDLQRDLVLFRSSAEVKLPENKAKAFNTLRSKAWKLQETQLAKLGLGIPKPS